MSEILLIGSCEPFSGKSAMVLGIAKKLLQKEKKVRIGKPLATCIELTNLPSMTYEGLIDDDVKFIGSTLNCLLYTSPSPRDFEASRMPSSA